MYPNREIAKRELKMAGELNPGPWTKHAENVAKAAKLLQSSQG